MVFPVPSLPRPGPSHLLARLQPTVEFLDHPLTLADLIQILLRLGLSGGVRVPGEDLQLAAEVHQLGRQGADLRLALSELSIKERSDE